ncbi:MAG: outer membrane protein assembly factor BamD [Syntrophales bacterium]
MQGIRAYLIPAAAIALVLIAGCAASQGRWERAAAADTIAAYEEFLRENPEGDWADRARLRRDELYEARDWREAETLASVSAYEEYLKNYPRGRYRDDARGRLKLLASPQEEQTPPLLPTEAFLQRRQQGLFLEETLATIEKLAFEQALHGNTRAAYEAFLRRYPAGRFAGEARQRMDDLWFAEVRGRDTVPAYEGYLKRYPQGIHADPARARLAELNTARPEPGWGQIMHPKGKANIRAKRSTASALRGRLDPGQQVKADFLRDGWYAVFSPQQERRDEQKALGYVYAPLLSAAASGAGSPGAAEEKGGPAEDAPAKSGEPLPSPVEIRNITFRTGGEGKELLCVEFDRFPAPAISGVEGGEPKILLEIGNAAPLKKEWALIDAGGSYVRRILARRDAATRTVLIVLDMEPAKSYFVNPAFFARDSTYCLEIAEEQPAR